MADSHLQPGDAMIALLVIGVILGVHFGYCRGVNVGRKQVKP